MADRLAEMAALQRERASALRQVEDAARREAASRDVLLAAKSEWETERFAMLDVLAELVAYDGRECAIDPIGECTPHAYPAMEAEMPCPWSVLEFTGRLFKLPCIPRVAGSLRPDRKPATDRRRPVRHLAGDQAADPADRRSRTP